MKIKMTKTVGILKKGEIYSIMEDYSNNPLNACINCEQREGFPCIPQFHDKREKYKNFTYVDL